VLGVTAVNQGRDGHDHGHGRDRGQDFLKVCDRDWKLVTGSHDIIPIILLRECNWGIFVENHLY
jgi:hypothetical protein